MTAARSPGKSLTPHEVPANLRPVSQQRVTSPDLVLPWGRTRGASEAPCPSLVLAWSLDEPERVGEILAVRGPACIGRGENLADDPAPRYTYSTIALLRAELFAPPWCDIAPGNPLGVKAPLAPLLRCAMDAGRVSASLYGGRWTDVGTPERLAELNR